MSTNRFGWKHVLFVAALAGGCFAAGAASGIAWDRFTFSGVMHLNNGGTANVVGEAVQQPDGTVHVIVDANGADLTSGGVMEMKMPDGGTGMFVTKGVEPANGREIVLPDGRKVRVTSEEDAQALLRATRQGSPRPK